MSGKVKGRVNRADFDMIGDVHAGWDLWRNLNGCKLTSGGGIKVMTERANSKLDAESGDYYVQLDSLASNGKQSNSAMSQNIKLSNGYSFLLG